ncbi:hypothetical protein [Caulobacter sp. NIBR1757]|uniref:hypothetical protein n=1 Tax=Caulobacter sp. NIBR1757 TaxID=3016000 RepID=UPI0022F0AC48|nr:hypothetical protein [Caulobacter sp. NIBR1757]WGM39875.1 hypothetical protein AMEJIAPC_02815 [Caulobacter sp. NIBR1757]
MSFSPVQASLEGFRFIRDRPRPVTVWMIALLVLNLAAALFNLSPWAQRLIQLQTARGFEWSWATLQDLALHLLPAAAIALFLTFASLCVVTPSIFRVMLGKTHNPDFRLGADEARMFWLFLAILLAITVAAVPFGIVLGLSRALAGPLAERVGLAGLMALLGPLSVLFLQAYFIIRLSLTAPVAIDQHRLDVMGSWKMTHGAFWQLLAGTALSLLWTLAVAFGAVIAFSLVAVLVTFVLGIPPGELSAFLFPSGQGYLDYFGPGPMLRRVFESALLAILFCVVCATVVYAYRELSPPGDEAPEPEDDILEHETAV